MKGNIDRNKMVYRRRRRGLPVVCASYIFFVVMSYVLGNPSERIPAVPTESDLMEQPISIPATLTTLSLLQSESSTTPAIPTREWSSSTEESTEARESTSESSFDNSSTTAPPPFCLPPAIQQFPRPLMGQNARVHGGLIIHLLVTVYMFIGLAIICDDYFVPSLDRLCETMNLSPDVAGATFMAAGSSAPELATSLIGVFVAQDDIGVSGVIGSAVFNIMFVISICGLFAGRVSYLNWWPLVRDSFFYMISILALIGTIGDKKVTWYESVILLLLYVTYCCLMYHNTALEAYAQALPVPFPRHLSPPQPVKDPEPVKEESNLVKDPRTGPQYSYTEERNGGTVPQRDIFNPSWSSENIRQLDMGGTTVINSVVEPIPIAAPPPSSEVTKPLEEEVEIDIFAAPEDRKKRILWAIVLPLVTVSYYTMPDCRKEKWKNYYTLTFIMSLLWISLFSYIMVWMITITGFTLGIPDTMMGLTFIAAGVSVPDALSSLAVVKEGLGDMAVSNAIGSNVFDILICLGLPWFLRTAITDPGSTVTVYSKGLLYSTISLLSTVAFLIIATHINGWKLDKRYGAILMVWYLLFMVFASLYELNIFGDYNPLECGSDF